MPQCWTGRPAWSEAIRCAALVSFTASPVGLTARVVGLSVVLLAPKLTNLAEKG